MPKPRRRLRRRTPLRRFLSGLLPGLLLLLVWRLGGLVRTEPLYLAFGTASILPAVGASQSGRGPLRGAVTGALLSAVAGMLLSLAAPFYLGSGSGIPFLQAVGLVPLGCGAGLLGGLAGGGPRRRGRRLGWTGMDALFLPVAWILLLALWKGGLGMLFPAWMASPAARTQLDTALGPLTLAFLLWRLLLRRGAVAAFLAAYRPGPTAAIGGILGGLVVLLMQGAALQWESPYLAVAPRSPLMQFPTPSLPFLVACLGVGILSPLAEEAYFRGFLYPVLSRRYGTAVAVFGSALAFAFLHGQAGLLLPLLIGGMILAGLYERTGSLWTPTIAHLVVNLAGVAAALLAHR